jgi:hypothetical protein
VEKKGTYINSKQDADDFCKEIIRRLVYRKYSTKVRFIIFSKKCKLEKQFVSKLEYAKKLLETL